MRFAGMGLALDALNVSVASGEIVCLFGGSGAGKSVALQIIAGLLPPSSGSVVIAGRSIDNPRESLQLITFISSAWNHLPRLTPIEHVRSYAALNGRTPSRGECVQSLRECGLPEAAFDARMSDLASEHRLLVWLSFSLLKRAPILLLDDPTRGLDPSVVPRLQRKILEKSAHTAVLLATQDPMFAAQADRVVVLAQGRPVLERRGTELTAQSLAAAYLRLLGQ
jgi:ABC-type multidrug transport system ATPase subunit